MAKVEHNLPTFELGCSLYEKATQGFQGGPPKLPDF